MVIIFRDASSCLSFQLRGASLLSHSCQRFFHKWRERRRRKRIDGADVDFAQLIGVEALGVPHAQEEIGIPEHWKIRCSKPEHVTHLRYPIAFQLDTLLEELRRQKYRIRFENLDASEFGVPQTRRRLFVLCDREREVPVIPRSRKPAPPASSILRLDGNYQSRPLYSDRRAAATIERAERAMSVLGKKVPFLIVYYGSDGAGGWQSLNRPLRTLTTLDRFGLVTWNGSEPMLRMLQVDELKTAMGFTKGYTMEHGTRRDRIKMIGNGVCPPVMKAVVQALIS